MAKLIQIFGVVDPKTILEPGGVKSFMKAQAARAGGGASSVAQRPIPRNEKTTRKGKTS